MVLSYLIKIALCQVKAAHKFKQRYVV